MCGGINNMFSIRQKKSTGSASLSSADHFGIERLARRGNLTHEDLVACKSFFWIGSLKHQVLAIITEIGFGIISAKRQLPDIGKMFFLCIVNNITCCLCL